MVRATIEVVVNPSCSLCGNIDYYTTTINRRNPVSPDFPLFDVLNIPSPCESLPGRPDEALMLSSSPAASPPLSFPDDQGRTVNYDTFPFCLAFTVTILSSEAHYLMRAQDVISREDLVSLRVGNDEIVFTMGGVTATFIPPPGETVFVDVAGEFVHFQICMSETGQATLYINCGDPIPVAGVTLPPTDISIVPITFLSNVSSRAASKASYTVHFSTAMDGDIITYFPVVRGRCCKYTSPRCDEGEETAIVQAQCNALPLDCSQASPLLEQDILQIVTSAASGQPSEASSISAGG